MNTITLAYLIWSTDYKKVAFISFSGSSSLIFRPERKTKIDWNTRKKRKQKKGTFFCFVLCDAVAELGNFLLEKKTVFSEVRNKKKTGNEGEVF